MGWYDNNSGTTTHPVGEKKANHFALYDMHGNVWEWCEDWYQDDFFQESAGASNPLCGNPNSGGRVIRGGYGSGDARLCRSAHRDWVHPSHNIPQIGLRPAWSSP